MTTATSSATVLVLNCGSSSIKYELIEVPGGARRAAGLVERIGEGGAAHVEHAVDGAPATACDLPLATHRDSLATVLALFDEHGPQLAGAGVRAVGHRVVTGGARFSGPVVIDADVVAAIEAVSPLAPLHNPANLTGITVAREHLPDLPHVAVFDTAFFADLPPAASTYALAADVAARHRIRRYGFHGTSHRYVSGRTPVVLGRDAAGLRQVVLHLGNGASASAVVGGRPVETSMGFTPLEGLVMGTRSGDVDPSVVVHLWRTGEWSADDVEDLLNRRSGMKGLAGSNDLRDVHRLIAAGDDAARLALAVYVHRLRKYVGAYAAVMGGIDALVFTAGVGENDAVVRAGTVAGLAFLGLEVDPARNAERGDEARVISPATAAGAVLVVPTDEELAIALETAALIEA